MEHVWKVHKMFTEQDYPTKTVCQVVLKCKSTSGEKQYVGEYSFNILNSGEGFIPFPELEEATVIGWCGDLSAQESDNASKLQEILDAPIEYALPWVR